MKGGVYNGFIVDKAFFFVHGYGNIRLEKVGGGGYRKQGVYTNYYINMAMHGIG